MTAIYGRWLHGKDRHIKLDDSQSGAAVFFVFLFSFFKYVRLRVLARFARIWSSAFQRGTIALHRIDDLQFETSHVFFCTFQPRFNGFWETLQKVMIAQMRSSFPTP